MDIGAICAKLGNALSAALPGFCAFYGCDTTSGFPVKGKKTFFKELVRNDRFHHAMSELGESTTIDTELYKKCEEAIYNIYWYKIDDVNWVRYEMLTKGAESQDIPPTKDALTLHIRRANYLT